MGLPDHRDLVIEELADSQVELSDQILTLTALLADVTFENVLLRIMFEQEYISRVHGEATLARTRRSASNGRLTSGNEA